MAQRPDLIPSRGAISEHLMMSVTRELTPEDLTRLDQAPKVSVPVLQKLRSIHHRQAQLLAQGKTVNEVAVIVGCTPQRLVQLQVDPAFIELMAYYHDQVMVLAMEDSARLKDKIIDVGEMAIDELRERLEDDGKRAQVSIGEIRKIAEFAMDRTVAPVKNSVPSAPVIGQITMTFGTPIRNPDLEASEPKTIEGKAEKPQEEE